jgi:hypothetical protein
VERVKRSDDTILTKSHGTRIRQGEHKEKTGKII